MNEKQHIASLIAAARSGDETSLSSLFDSVESVGPAREIVLGHLHRQTGAAQRIGLAGPPGAGKSTLLTHLAGHYSASNERVGIVSVDATGHCGGGSLLGDRMRRNQLELAENILVRSVEVRPGGENPGLLTSLVADVMDFLGHAPLLLESVGLGPGQIEVVRRAHTVILLVPPGHVDPEQLARAGLLAIADLLVVNMGDREGAPELAASLRSQIEATPFPDGEWRPEVVVTVAYRGEGIMDLLEAIEAHQRFLITSGKMEQRHHAALRRQLRLLVESRLRERMSHDEALRELLDGLAATIEQGDEDVGRVAARLATRVAFPDSL